MKVYNRRNFLRVSATATSLLSASQALASDRFRTEIANDDTLVKKLIERAIESAVAGGAEYADVRFTHNKGLRVSGAWVPGASDDKAYPYNAEMMSVGVRALVNQTWGFASSTLWTPDEVARLGKEAANQARTISRDGKGAVILAPNSSKPNGTWEMPVQVDPFDLDTQEIGIYLNGIRRYADNYTSYRGAQLVEFKWIIDGASQDKIFGSTDDSYCKQRMYLTQGSIQIKVAYGGAVLQASIDGFSPAAVGFEMFLGSGIRERFRATIDDLIWQASLTTMPIDVGRYDIVMDAFSVGSLVSKTLGLATELDRALGFEANASGTSYLTSPAEMLDSFQIGNPMLNVTANRSESKGAATVKWDDEGIEPRDFDLIRKGVVTGYSVGRESAGWLRLNAPNLAQSLESNGCMLVGGEMRGFLASGGGINVPLNHTPNLKLAPSSSDNNIETLIGDVKKGIAFRSLNFDMDFQQLNGLGIGPAFEIRNGKIVGRLSNAAILFRAPEIWKNLVSLGGQSSAERFGQTVEKGEPSQVSYHSVTAVPATFKEIAVIDSTRKA